MSSNLQESEPFFVKIFVKYTFFSPANNSRELLNSMLHYHYLLDAVTSSGILKAKQKLDVTFNSDKLGGIAFTKISKLTMCSA